MPKVVFFLYLLPFLDSFLNKNAYNVHRYTGLLYWVRLDLKKNDNRFTYILEYMIIISSYFIEKKIFFIPLWKFQNNTTKITG